MKKNVNKRQLEITKMSLKRDYDKALKKGIYVRDLKTYVKRDTNNSKGILIGSSIPAAITISIGAAGVVTLFVTNIITTVGKGFDPNFTYHTKELTEFIENTKNLVSTMGRQTLINLCIPSFYLFLTKYKLNKKIEVHANRFFTKEEAKKVTELDEQIKYIDGVNNLEDDSFEDARDFFDNTDISNNSMNYNKELIKKLSHEDNQSEIESFLENSNIEEGASKEFLTSPSVKKLIKK